MVIPLKLRNSHNKGILIPGDVSAIKWLNSWNNYSIVGLFSMRNVRFSLVKYHMMGSYLLLMNQCPLAFL